MHIRKMVSGDYPAVYALWMSCAGMGLNDLDDSFEGIARFLKRNPDTCLVAAEGNRIVGVILCGSDGRRAYVYHTAVSPEYRRGGLGTRLVDCLLTQLAAIGIHKAALVVFARNEGGNAFWQRQGFTVRQDLVYRNKALHEMQRIDT